MRIPAIALAVALRSASQRSAARRRRRMSPGRPAEGKGTIVVGVSGAFTENQLVAEMYARVLEHAGYTVERQFDLRSREISQTALESGQIDLKPEYLSSLLFFLDANAEHSSDPGRRPHRIVRLLEPRGISVLTPSPAQDTKVRGERRDGAAVRADDDDVARPGRRPADVRGAAGMPPTALLPPGPAGSTGSSSTTSSRWTRGARRPSPRSRTTTCRSACCSRPTRASRRTGSSRSSTTSTCRMRRTSRR